MNEQDIKKHFDEDRVKFKNIEDKFINQEMDHAEFRKTLLEIKGFIENLSWLSDITKGTQLLRKPSLWLLALVLGVVALSGGLKALVVGILSALGIKQI